MTDSKEIKESDVHDLTEASPLDNVDNMSDIEKVYYAIHGILVQQFGNGEKQKAYALAKDLILKNIAVIIRAHCLMIMASTEKDPYAVENAQEALRLLGEDCRQLADDDIHEMHVKPGIERVKAVLKSVEEIYARTSFEDATADEDEVGMGSSIGNDEGETATRSFVEESEGVNKFWRSPDHDPIATESQKSRDSGDERVDQDVIDDEMLVPAEHPSQDTTMDDEILIIAAKQPYQDMTDDNILSSAKQIDQDMRYRFPLPTTAQLGLQAAGSQFRDAPEYLTPISMARTAKTVSRHTHSSNTNYAGGVSRMFDYLHAQRAAPTSRSGDR